MADSPETALARVPSPAEREAVIARLSTAFSNDGLSLDELDWRIAAAYRAVSRAELVALTEDLAQTDPAPVARPSHPVPTPSSERHEAPRSIGAVFANVERNDIREVPARLDIRAVFANVELDLSATRFTHAVTEISVHTVFGNVELQLPPNVAVENRGSSMLGNFECRVGPRSSLSPVHATVRIIGNAVFGNVEVTVGE